MKTTGGLADQVFRFFLGPQLASLFGLGQSETFLSNRAVSDLDNEDIDLPGLGW